MIIRWLINAVVLLGCAYLIPGIHVDGFVTALIAVVVIGAINMVVRPIFIILTIPITMVLSCPPVPVITRSRLLLCILRALPPMNDSSTSTSPPSLVNPASCMASLIR